jgi:hypothetical protein
LNIENGMDHREKSLSCPYFRGLSNTTVEIGIESHFPEPKYKKAKGGPEMRAPFDRIDKPLI